MSVLAVMDLKDGIVVRGIAGQRATYQAIRSQFAADPSPETVARGLTSTFGFRDVYVADLNAIGGDSPVWQAYETIADCGLNLIVDAGIRDRARANLFCNYANRFTWLQGVVVGLESIPSTAALRESAQILGPKLAVFSLDLKNGQPITAVQPWRSAAPEKVVEEAIEAGFRRVIVLDLAAIGVDQGPRTGSLCRILRERFPLLEIVSGGGVRTSADIQVLLDAGCNRVLVASALHDGRLDDLKAAF
jgi:phosphoribosylformimino-5-aminoimidazole carboxamide ribotide isomerase